MPEIDALYPEMKEPNTLESLKADFLSLGLERGMVLLVHSSLRRLGWVCGGPVTVVQALEDLLGPEGTLVMPSHSTDLTDPAGWCNPPVPESWWQTIRDTMPAFDPHLTPVRQMGAVVECFLRQPGTLRSMHPHTSFAARGRCAETIVHDHALCSSMGEQSPLARLYDLDARVLLLGVGHENNSSLHLAEYRSDFQGKKKIIIGAPVKQDGQRSWVWFEDIEQCCDDFGALGSDYEKNGDIVIGKVGCGEARLMRQRDLVDFGVDWMVRNRNDRI